MKLTFSLLVAGLLCLSSVHAADPEIDDTNDAPASGIELGNFDHSVRPQDDFYQYVNGEWIRRTTIPPDRSGINAFLELDEQAELDLHAIISELVDSAGVEPGSERAKIRDYYSSFMDSARVESLGAAPLESDLAEIDAIAGKEDLARYVARLQLKGISAPFVFYVMQDLKDAREYAVYLDQTGLGLPDREFYFSDQFENARDAYLAYVETLHELADLPGPAAAAGSVMELEAQLAEHQWSRVQNRDRDATYNKFAMSDLAELAPGFEWAHWADEAELSIDSIIVRQPDYLAAAARLLGEHPIDAWKTYFRHRLVSSSAPYLSSPFVNARFELYGRTLAGTETDRPRWKRAVSATEGALGEALGKLYVARHFRPDSKARMDELVENLRRAFDVSIRELEWMSEDTKEEALAKLAKFSPKIGYPDSWRDYSALEVDPADLFGNIRRSSAHAHARTMARIGQPVDRTEWFMTPQTVNAYYSPSRNEVVFPAAILQPPFFNPEADDAVNYGAIGGIIGHEFSHGFDDQGRKSDGDGNLRDWWTNSDAEEFNARAQGLIEQYSAYSPIPGMYVNGELTLGENIGDLAGLTMAYRAYQLSLDGDEAPVIDGLTGDQRFFIGWAQGWRTIYREENLKERLVTDSHSPNMYRTNGIVSNIPGFYEAFDVKAGDAMYIPPEKRVKIW